MNTQNFDQEIHKNLRAQYLGRLSYEEALQWQKIAWKNAYQYEFESILGLEHFPVISLGNSAGFSEIVSNMDELIKSGFEVCKSQRGGQATLHNPGQLVIYPILKVKSYAKGVKEYVQLLLECTQKCLQDYGLDCSMDLCQPGVYTETGKIAFVGLKIDRGISYHGISINIANQLEDFSYIKSCGLEGARLDRLANHCANVSLGDVFKTWAKHFSLKIPK